MTRSNRSRAFIAVFVFTCVVNSGVLSQGSTVWPKASSSASPGQSHETLIAPLSSSQSSRTIRTSTQSSQPYTKTNSGVLSQSSSVWLTASPSASPGQWDETLITAPASSQSSRTNRSSTQPYTKTKSGILSPTASILVPPVSSAVLGPTKEALKPITSPSQANHRTQNVSERTQSPSPTPSVSSANKPFTSRTPEENNMYPYGQKENDNEFKVNDSLYYWHCPEIRTDSLGFPFFGERHYKLFICTNGKIQLNYEWSWWWPQKFGVYRWFRKMAIISPFWATTDEYMAFKAGNSKMYYHVYEDSKKSDVQTSRILRSSSQYVRSYDNSGKFANFTATWVLVVTWEKICPYVYYPYYYYYSNTEAPELNCEWSNTFQAVIITDGFNSFLMYNYPKGGIKWVVPVLPSYYRYWTSAYGVPVAGWNAGDNGKNYLNMKGSGTLLGMYGLDEKPGNTGVQGRHFWRIENNNADDARSKCLKWALFQQKTDFLSSHNLHFRDDRRVACPCSAWQAWSDRRFIWDWMSSWPKWCYRSRRSIYLDLFSSDQGLVTIKMTQLCCYSTQWPGDWGALKTGPPDGGHVEVINQWSNSVEEVFTDQQAYKYCCADVPMCSLFYENRPSDNCALYEPPAIRWFWGDPHFTTLDGGNYTFNGLGEYVMIDAQDGAFQLQARTGLAQRNSTTATIFTAGAAKEKNTSTVEVRVRKGGGIVVLIDQTVYSGYNNLTNRSVEIGKKLSISKPKENCLEVSFPSSTSVQFCEQKEMLSFVVTPGDDYKNVTKGLMGTWNDDPDDDFTLPDGTVLLSSSTSRQIHFGFGVKWQINQSQSLFTYAQNEGVNTFAKPDFEPMFADNITWHNESVRQAAEEQCGDDYECLFDTAATNDLSIGMATKQISVQLLNESKVLDNFPPKIVNTPKTINATLHQTVQLNITAEDNDTISFQVINKPAGAMARQSGNVLHFTWPVTSSQKFNLSFVATDNKGASAAWSPTINMCACNHDGQCVQPEEGDPVNTESKFVYMACSCQGGYTGRFCDSDIDACEMNGQPCYADVKCIDLPPPANVSGYTCGPCPSGYTGNGAQCAEIDECQSSQTNNCEQICVNVPGSFLCDCRDGYKLTANRHNCKDVNECEPTNDCMQKCINTQGSYNCSCDQYFHTDPVDWRKCLATNPCSPGHGCQHVCFKGNNNQPTCACFANYELESDGKKCKDINECDSAKDLNSCDQICENTPGSYKCSCQNGFELSKNGYDCEDINECLDEDMYNCTDEFHKCVNTRGSYKCECDQGLYFIDGRCRGLAKNETAPPPVLPNPRQPSTKEREQAVQISIEAESNFDWDYQIDKSFKDKIGSVTSTFCEDNRTACALKEGRRYRRTPLLDLYTADQTHLLPGYPTNTRGSLLVAFYVQQPSGLFLGNTSVLPGRTLLSIVVTYQSELESALGANISGVELLVKTTKESPTETPVEEERSDKWKWIAIGVGTGVFVIVLIVVIGIWRNGKKGKISVRPAFVDGTEEPISMEPWNVSTQRMNRKMSL